MKPSLSLVRVVPVVLASLLAAACASEPVPADEGGRADEGEVTSTEDEVRASCTSPRKYFATFRNGSGGCTVIVGHRGRWVPEPLFVDAPADVQLSTCAFRWAGAKGSPPDRERLLQEVGFENGLAPACGTSSAVSLGNLQPIPSIDILTQGGSVGCDVCGIVRDRVVWAILPPEKTRLKQFAVRLSDGQERAFQISGAEGPAVSITLPPPPRGTKYVQGRVTIF